MVFSLEGKIEGIGIGKKILVSRVCDFWGGGVGEVGWDWERIRWNRRKVWV